MAMRGPSRHDQRRQGSNSTMDRDGQGAARSARLRDRTSEPTWKPWWYSHRGTLRFQVRMTGMPSLAITGSEMRLRQPPSTITCARGVSPVLSRGLHAQCTLGTSPLGTHPPMQSWVSGPSGKVNAGCSHAAGGQHFLERALLHCCPKIK